MIIIDYLQLMKLNTTMESRVQEISYITRNLKILAKEFEIPILVLSQLSRGVESRVNKRPMLSDLIIVAGRPSMGKTAFALNLAKRVVEKYNLPLLIFSLEMSRQQIIYRFISTEAKINNNRLKSNKMTSGEWKQLSKAMVTLSKLPIFIDDNSNLTVSDIRAKLRKVFIEFAISTELVVTAPASPNAPKFFPG